MKYDPSIFDAATMQDAKNIILTAEQSSPAHRWEVETEFLISLLDRTMPIWIESVVLDYGCGIGRLSKALIDRYGCQVIGVDTSPRMRDLAVEYVRDNRFRVLGPEERIPQCAAAISVWCLQHCLDPARELDRICDALPIGGDLFVVDSHRRAVPCEGQQWVNDGVSVKALIDARFAVTAYGKFPPSVLPVEKPELYYWLSAINGAHRK